MEYYLILLYAYETQLDAQRRCLTATESGTDSNSENYSTTSISRESGEGRSGWNTQIEQEVEH
jgi:hypothetical protein